MAFEIKGKVALVAGGINSSSLAYAKELMRNGLKAVSLAGTESLRGRQAVKELEKEFGANKAIFIRIDVTDYKQFEDAFKKTVNQFKNVDILINSAGIYDDTIWEPEIAVNVNGVVHGTLLALENYLPRCRSGDEAVIINLTSIAGIDDFAFTSYSTVAKHAVVDISRAFGSQAHYQRTKVKVITVCPGEISDAARMQELSRPYNGLFNKNIMDSIEKQSSQDTAKAVVDVIRKAKTGSVWIVKGTKEPHEMIVPRREEVII